MKYLLNIAVFSFLALNGVQAQNINWKWAEGDNRHYGHVNFGYDFGITTQLGYSYLTQIKKPLLLTADYSFPMGKDLLDDHKIRLGGQIQAFEQGNLMLTVKLYGSLKRHETNFVRMFNLGLETSGLLGFYKPKWHIAAELGWMKPATSHLKHSGALKDNFPSVTDGWYTSNGGYYFYGIQAGKSITKSWDLSLNVGATNAINDHKEAIIARYARIGLLKMF